MQHLIHFFRNSDAFARVFLEYTENNNIGNSWWVMDKRLYRYHLQRVNQYETGSF